MAVVEKLISEVKQEFQESLKQYILEDIREIPRNATGERSDNFKQGAYGKVIHLDWGGTTCVGKVLHSVFFESSTERAGMREVVKKFFKEIKLLSQMKNQNIVRFLGLYYQRDSSLPVLVMEKMEYNLTEYLETHEKGSIPECKVLGILLDVSRGLVYLHKDMMVAHRDLSSNNILLTADLSAKIADFGSARVLDRPGGWVMSAKLTIQPGIVDFMPPEALLDNPQYTVSVDMFSFGCVIIHLSTHKWPKPIAVPKGKFISEIERRKDYILEMAGSYLLPMVEQCLEESNDNRPASEDVMSILQAKIEENKADYTIVFAGITGVGKSAAGNFILNKEDVFSTEGGLLAVTDKCSAGTSTICGKTVKIIDTPGFFDGFTPNKESIMELTRALTLAKDGIHAVAFVMNYNRYTPQCEEAIKQLLHFKGLQPFVFVILTHARTKGKTKAETDELIQQTLSNSRCPQGLKDLMQMVENRVIMMESVDLITENYCEQKRIEFLELVESLHKNNAYKVYLNPVLQFTAQVYEKARLQQKSELQEKTKTLKVTSERIVQLKKQADHAANTEGAKKINNEIADLNKRYTELQTMYNRIADDLYPEDHTHKTLVTLMQSYLNSQKDQMTHNKYKFMLFMGSFLSHHIQQSPDEKERNMTQGKYIGGLVVTGIAAFIPGEFSVNINPIYLGGCAGALVGNVYGPASRAYYDNCKQQ